MVLILSTEIDTATLHTLRWLHYYKQLFIRLNDLDRVELNKIAINNNQTEHQEIETAFGKIDLSKVQSYWYRRGYLHLDYSNTKYIAINQSLKEDNDDIEEYLYLHFDSKHNINRLKDTFINKLICLKKAVALGISIPNTIVVSNKSDLADFYHSNDKNIITKGIYNGFSFEINDVYYSQGTTLFDYEQLENEIPDNFFPTLFQSYTDKKYELRIFYLKGKFFSSVIFSQNDEQTKIDFRNYNTVSPNRVNPFRLPLLIEDQLRKLMEELQLSSGSIDMIYTPEGNYIFLEVNPIGQFAQVSDPCNYYLHQKIATYLINQNL